MIQLYQCGQTGVFTWRGICEYDDEQERCRYHKDGLGAPHGIWVRMRREDLAEHIANRWWVPFQPELQLPEGL